MKKAILLGVTALCMAGCSSSSKEDAIGKCVQLGEKNGIVIRT